jgi:methylated-DNA-[protein]-cysteine S-methyltransferase
MILESPFGPLKLFSNGTALIRLMLPSQLSQSDRDSANNVDPILDQACKELESYFAGTRTEFHVPFASEKGTEFQRQVWSELSQIPVGTTITYSELAVRVGRPSAVRAVGAANGRNEISIIVPCHRVIGANGSLTGFAGGLELKRQLLEHEKAIAALRSLKGIGWL